MEGAPNRRGRRIRRVSTTSNFPRKSSLFRSSSRWIVRIGRFSGCQGRFCGMQIVAWRLPAMPNRQAPSQATITRSSDWSSVARSSRWEVSSRCVALSGVSGCIPDAWSHRLRSRSYRARLAWHRKRCSGARRSVPLASGPWLRTWRLGIADSWTCLGRGLTFPQRTHRLKRLRMVRSSRWSARRRSRISGFTVVAFDDLLGCLVCVQQADRST